MANSSDQWAGSDGPLDRSLRDPMPDDPAAIRAEIEDTRSRMSDTLDELGERLNPNVVKEKVKDTIRDATIGRVENMARDAAEKVGHTGRGILDKIRDNPVPAVIIGVGVAWMLWSRQHSDDREMSRNIASYDAGAMNEDDEWGESSAYDSDWSERGNERGVVRKARERGHDIASDLKEKTSDLAHRAQDVAGHAGERAKELVGRVGDKTKNAASQVGERARGMGGAVANKSRQQARRAQDSFFENPLAVGALTLAVGFAVGMSVPESEAESRLMGERRDQLVGKVRDLARDKGEKVKNVAERVFDEGKRVAKEAAREEGLTKA